MNNSMSISRIGINKGNKNAMWKGDKVKYAALHDWVKSHKPKLMFCEKCGEITNKLEIANISGEYKRDISDFRWLCRKCHMKSDGRFEVLKRTQFKFGQINWINRKRDKYGRFI